MPIRKFIYIRLLALIMTALLPAGCSLFGPRVDIDSLSLDVAPRANDDSPIAVDFVAANDSELLARLSELTARQWFATREQYQRDFRQHLYVWGLELVPGQLIESTDFPLEGKPAVGLLVFANFQSPGAHRLRLEEQRTIRLKFDNREMTSLEPNPR